MMNQRGCYTTFFTFSNVDGFRKVKCKADFFLHITLVKVNFSKFGVAPFVISKG